MYDKCVLDTHLCHVSWLRFRWDNLAVDDVHVVSQVCVHDRGFLHLKCKWPPSLSLSASLIPESFGVIHGHWVSCGPTTVSYSCWFVQVCVFFEPLTEWSLGFTYVCVAAVDVTRDVVDGSTLVFFWCFVYWMLYH